MPIFEHPTVDIMYKLLVITLTLRGVIGLSSAFIRLAPDYESPLETQELMGTCVEVLGSERYWRHISTPQPYEGWTTSMSVVQMDSATFAAYEKAPKYICTSHYAKVIEKPCRDAAQICDLVAGNRLRISLSTNATPIVKGSYAGVKLPDGRNGWVERNALETVEKWEQELGAMTPESKAAAIVDFAKSMLGTPYLWGGMTVKGVDCSGLVRLSFLMHGVLLPRNASQQVRCGKPVDPAIPNLWRPGDLLFFGKSPEKPTHVGICIGNGKMIHSSMCVRINSLQSGAPDRYENAHRLVAVRRIFE